MSTTDEDVDKPLQLAELRILDAHHWGTTALTQHLDGMKHYAIPALELAGDEDWMAMAKGAASFALQAAEVLVHHLANAVEALDEAAVYAERYQP